jgi:CDGSH-type Zn-finger protein
MARLVRHDARGPAIIQVGEKIVAVCQCGLSGNKPFCDGSHQRVQDEEPNRVYAYDSEKRRVPLDDLFPTPKRKFEAP